MAVKKRFLIFFLFCIFFLPARIFADSCCTLHGGDYYCNYSTSQLYCADGTVSSDCTCHAGATPTPTVDPTDTPTPTPTPPPCPEFSTYNSTSNACTCITGYVVSDSVCIPYQQFCWTKYGGNSVYNSSANNCSCNDGYTWNSDETSCISFSQLCQNKLGSESYYNTDSNTCNCYDGFAIQNNECQIIPTEIPTISPSTSELVITNIPIPTQKIEKVIPSKSPTPTKYIISSAMLNSIVKGNIGTSNFISVEKPQPSVFVKIFTGIWNFLIHLF